MAPLSDLPPRVSALEMGFNELRAEMRALHEETRAEMRALNEGLRNEMHVLHEDVISRIALLQERPRRSQRKL